MFKKVYYVIAIVSCLSLYSCKKTPGAGGNARIRGKVWVKQYNPAVTILQSEYYGPNISVIMTYGEDISPDQSVSTNSNGEFEFQYMRQGKYKITVYSKVFKDSIHPSGVIPKDTIITITKRKEIMDIGTIIIQK